MSTVETSPHSRAFGVEIEFGVDANSFDTDEWGDLDYEEFLKEFKFDDYCRNPEGWEWGEDGTMFEFRSPILQGAAGFAELRRMMKTIRDKGGYVSSEDGLHVHHNAPEFVNSLDRTVQLVRSWNNNIQAIHEMVNPNRHEAWACPGWSTHQIERLLHDGPEAVVFNERPDLNIFALSSHGTIEIRLHEGTLNPDVAEAWVKFGQRFIYEVLSQTEDLVYCADDAELMSRLKLSASAQAAIAAKKARGHYDAA